MDYKRIEVYVGWTCNQKCSYCIEYEHMEHYWNKIITKYEILKLLLKYKTKGYNHITYLGGEPFIQPVFEDALKLGKKLGYTILVTTNATTLHIEKEAKKYLSYIDELVLSVEALDKELQQKISRSKTFVIWDKVFDNINKYWNGRYLKANIVITKDNLIELVEIVRYLIKKGVKNIAITYPDVRQDYYNTDHIINYITPKYNECVLIIIDILKLCESNNINLNIVDFPFCIFPKKYIEKIVKMSDDFNYQGRLKIESDQDEDYRDTVDLPREREHIKKCEKCFYNNICWGPGKKYIELFGDKEIISIKNCYEN